MGFCGGDNDECALEQIDRTIHWLHMGPSDLDIRNRLRRLIALAHEEADYEGKIVGSAIVAWGCAIQGIEQVQKRECRLCKVPLSWPYTLCITCADEQGP